jgi:hypothetical protein
VFIYIKQLVVRKDMDVNEHERRSNITLRHKLKEQLVVRKDMDVNEHERLSNITLRHKLKEQLVVRKDKNVNEHERLSNITFPPLLNAYSLILYSCGSIVRD